MKEISYDEIILQIRKENAEALRLLFFCFEKHFRIFEKKAIYSYRMSGYAFEDIRRILEVMTVDVIRRYEMDKSAFFAFWKIIVGRRLFDLYEKERFESSVEYNKISLDSELMDFFYDEAYFTDPLQNYIAHDQYADALQRAEDAFGARTSQILRMWSEGFSYGEIAEALRISPSKVNYELSKAIRLVRERK